MLSLLAEAGDVFASFLSDDAWAMREALRTPGAWIAGLIITIVGALALLGVYRLAPVLDRNLDRTIMVVSYLAIAGIISVEVFRRFVLNEQAPWSTTLPPFLFLIMTWFGCAYNVRLRTHLAFSEFRTNLPRTGQILCLCLDAVLWLGFCWIVIVTSARLTANSAANFQILLGTDDVLQWWFLISVPIAFVLMAARVIENLIEDIGNYRSGKTLIKQAVIGGE
ncbi:MAG: TRAP transporter small permease subunit [Pseudomonadota bacterium]